MSSTSAGESDQYALVSSFYGSGATVGWYLTALACFFSFGVHLRKRRLDKITADTIAVITFPTVAAVHLISQVRSYPRLLLDSDDGVLVQHAASVEAALLVTETFLAMDVILFLLAVGFKCVRRACLLAVAGLFCFSAECYLHFSRSVRQAIERDLSRPFLINFASILMSIMTILLLCIALATGLIVLFLATRPTPAQTRASDQDPEATQRHRASERVFKKSRHARMVTLISMLFLPLSFIASVFPLWSDVLKDLPPQFLPWLHTAASHIARDLVPRSSTSAKELDQAVAMLAGGTVLGFSLHSTADSYYRAWLSRARVKPQQQDVELTMLGSIQTPVR